jgi:hypothetical protein
MYRTASPTLVFALAGSVAATAGCSDTGQKGMDALANSLKQSSQNLAVAAQKIDPAGINRLLTEVDKLRKERDDAERRAKEAGDLMAGMIPLAVVGSYKNPATGKPTRVEHVDGSRFSFISGNGSKEELRYDVARRTLVRANGRTAAFFFPETRTIAFDGDYWKP